MIDILSQPIEGVSYLYDDIPDIEIDTQIAIGFSIKLGDVVLYSNTYASSQSNVIITGLGAMIRNSLLLANIDYQFTYMLNEEGDGGTAVFFTLTAKRNHLAADIVSGPETNSLYFQKSIPDIIIDQNVVSALRFELKKGSELILSEEYVFDVDGKIKIRNISEIVENYLSEDNLICQFTCTITHDSIHSTIDFEVLKCEAEMTVDANSWTQQNFLTRAYGDKRTAKSRNEYLSYLQRPAYGALTINYRVVYYSSGRWTEAVGTMGNIAAVTADKIATFNASMGALVTAAALSPSTEIIQYDIWLTGTGVDTDKYSYLVDNNIYRNHKHFVFTNSFGVLETFTATGRSDVKKTGDLNFGRIDNRYRKVTQDFLSEKTVNSGFLEDEELEWIDDLLLSFNVSTYVPGVTGSDEEITITSWEKTESEVNGLQAFLFTYRRAEKNHLRFVNAAQGIFDETFDETFN